MLKVMSHVPFIRRSWNNAFLGMFLYGKLVMQDLYSVLTRGDLLDAIKDSNFPKGLKEA
jgi:hypothetical protein